MRNAANTRLIVGAIVVLAFEVFAETASLQQAMQLFQQHHWAEAASAFDQIEKAEPGKTAASLYRGKALVNLGNFDEAAVALGMYRAAHPESADVVYLLAYVRFRQDKPKESLQLYSEGARFQTPTADDLKAVALDYVLLGDYDDAARYLEQALAADPENVEARYHLGRVRYQQNRFDLAIAAFEEVLRREPGNVKAEDNLGLSLEAKNEVDAALAAYRKAVQLDENLPTHSEQPYLNLGTLLEKSGHAEDAVLLLERAAKISPASGKTHYQLAKAYFELSRFESARQEAETAIKLDPRESSDHYLLGRIYQRSGKADLAKEEFRMTEELIHARGASSSGMASER
ncbi:MAG TPA: tetratricopeptide repeat protein [Terriglobales bacterium]|jgi:tetratricopeptide (TPR) repeat protein|nr:tetratricopeptide repeat protein [Terriglobales bacterium]